MKIRPAFEDASIPLKPQLHTRKHHSAYNGARSLPIFTWVRPSTKSLNALRSHATTWGGGGSRNSGLGARTRDRDRYKPQPLISSTSSSSATSAWSATLYEVKLYYSKNRACTIYRSWDDFVRLGHGLSLSGGIAMSTTTGASGAAVAAAAICTERHPHSSTCLQKFLKHVMQRFPKEPAVEFFLRRRIDDCGGCV